MASDEVDVLLERYLLLLDRYSTQREQLNSLQATMYQDIARANFAAERGMRFGQDQYDDRMQAIRTLTTTADHAGLPRFSVVVASTGAPASKEADTQTEADAGTAPPESSSPDGTPPDVGRSGYQNTPDSIEEDESNQEREREQRAEKTRKDPLKWFGYLTPSALRHAQNQAVEAVEGVILSLAAINAEMAHVEIEVRRARKRRDKAEAATARALASAGGSNSASGQGQQQQQQKVTV